MLYSRPAHQFLVSLEHEEVLRKGVPLALARELQAKLLYCCFTAVLLLLYFSLLRLSRANSRQS